MSEHATGQLANHAAEFYDSRFVPSLFQPWAPLVVDSATLNRGDHVLDVACGTGVVARQALSQIDSGGSIVGLDCNEGMLAVARREPNITWCDGDAQELPFDDGVFNAVLCQFGLMFFSNQCAAIEEMWRVLAPGGRLVICVWDALDKQPAHQALCNLLRIYLGDAAAESLHSPYSLGRLADLNSLFGETSIPPVAIQNHEKTASFNSIAEWIEIEIRAWTLAATVSDSQLKEIQDAGEQALQSFVTADGTLRYPTRAHLVVAQRGNEV